MTPTTTVVGAVGAPLVLQAARSVGVDPDRPTARRWAVEELSQQEYVQAQPNLLQRALLWVFDRIDSLLVVGGGAGVGLALVVGTVVVLAVVVVALLLAGPLRGGLGRRRGAADVFGEVVRTAAEHRAAAGRAAADQRWAQAVQESFRATARTLEERVVLDRRPGRTADEIAVEGGAALPAAAQHLTRAARVFDDVTYGDRPGDEAGYALCLAADEAVRTAPAPGLLAAVGTGPQVPA